MLRHLPVSKHCARALLPWLASGGALACGCQEYDDSLLRYSDAAGGSEASTDASDGGLDAPPDGDASSLPDVSDASEDASDAADAFDAFDAEADGPPACSSTQADCDGDGANGCETDLTSTPAHCGACNRDCLGGDCLDAQCQPVELASGQQMPSFVHLDATHLYWTNQGGAGAVMRLSKQGGTPEHVASTDFPPGGLAVDDTTVFWSEFGSPGSVWRLDKSDIGSTTDPTALATGQGTSITLTLDATTVFWATPGTVRKVPKTGGSVKTLAHNQGQPFTLLEELGVLYWTNTLSGEVMRFDDTVPDAGVETLATGQAYPVGLAMDLANLYWSNFQGSASGDAPRVMMMAKINMSEPVVLADDQAGPSAITAFGDELFWTNNVGGSVMRMKKVNGTPTQIADGQGAPAGITVDADRIYWVNRDDGRVMAVAR